MFEFIPYQLILTTHIIAFSLNIFLVVVSDSLGALWVIGKKKTLPRATMYRLHKTLWGGLVLSILSGGIMFSEAASYLLGNPAFQIKMALVLALVINSFLISHHLELAVTKPFSETTPRDRMKMLISGAVSTISWVGVVVAAFQLGL